MCLFRIFDFFWPWNMLVCRILARVESKCKANRVITRSISLFNVSLRGLYEKIILSPSVRAGVRRRAHVIVCKVKLEFSDLAKRSESIYILSHLFHEFVNCPKIIILDSSAIESHEENSVAKFLVFLLFPISGNWTFNNVVSNQKRLWKKNLFALTPNSVPKSISLNLNLRFPVYIYRKYG